MTKKVVKNGLKTFYDPHPGIAGALFPIPGAVQRVAEKLNGKKLPLKEALTRIKKVTRGKVEVVQGKERNFIYLDLGCNAYRVICFR